MSRRSNLPGAAELFRATTNQHDGRSTAGPSGSGVDSTASEPTAPPVPVTARTVRTTRRIQTTSERAPTGRERHEEKITVYCSPEELMALESARLMLRAEHGMAVDRGRIVREAVAVVLADLQAKGEASILIRRLREP